MCVVVTAVVTSILQITNHTAHLLTRRGIGPDNAAAVLIAAGDNPDRLHSEASFAALCGVNPQQASSGKTTRHRLNRGGDRQANAALYRITLSRLRWDTRTRDYLARRITEGKTRREAIRCLIGELSGARLEDRVVIPSVVPGDGPVAVPLRWPV